MEKLLIFDSAKEVRFGKLLKFIIPTYLTALFNTVYTIVDGIFVSSYVGTNALAAINIVYPIVNILTGIALAFATGGSALAALHISGERKEEANRTFSVSMLLSLLVGCGVSALIWIKLPALLELLGATQLTMSDCKTYAFWWLVGTPVVIGKELLTYFIRVDGSPTYSFLTALAGGLLNIVLDYVFVGCMDMGILGAALATILSQALAKTVWLKSGGNLVIEPTEALTVIDVNTAKSVSKKTSEETYLKTNLEAAEAIAVQLRLRNLSGIIIVDFIDMKEEESRKALLAAMRRAVAADPVKTVLVDMTPLGLVELTRKKIRRPLHEQVRV